MSITLGIDNVCYVHTMKSNKLDLQGFLDKAVLYGAGAVQMDPSWPSQGLTLTPYSLKVLREMLDDRELMSYYISYIVFINFFFRKKFCF